MRLDPYPSWLGGEGANPLNPVIEKEIDDILLKGRPQSVVKEDCPYIGPNGSSMKSTVSFIPRLSKTFRVEVR